MQPRLEEIKKEFELSQSELKLYHNLTLARESILAQIHTLKKNMEADRAVMHRLQDVYPQKALVFMERFEEHKEHIAQLLNSLKKIDAQLDQLGEEKEATAAKSKHKLLRAIQEHIPESCPEYAVAEKALQEVSKKNELLKKEHELLLPLLHLLRQGAQIPLNGTFRFSFLFGRHPKAMLARRIHQVITLAEKHLPQIQDIRFKLYLDQFLKEAKQPSNRALYQGKFSELATEFSLLMSELATEITKTNEELVAYERAIETWIEKHSSSHAISSRS